MMRLRGNHPLALRDLSARDLSVAILLVLFGCGEEAPCGPRSSRVLSAVDGDTVVLESGERVRYLLVDAPETQPAAECYGAEATQFNRDLVEGRSVQLDYDVECHDGYGRLLAYVTVGQVDVSETLIAHGYARVLRIPPNGAERIAEMREVQAEARRAGRGLWGACQSVP